MQKFCKQCGMELKKDHKFCSKCGKAIEEQIEKETPNEEIPQSEESVQGAESVTTEGLVETEEKKENGSPLKQEDIKKTNIEGDSSSKENPSSQNSADKFIKDKKANTKKIPAIIGGCLFLVAIIAAVNFFANRPQTVDLNNYISYEITGYNTAGKCNVKFDYDKFNEDISETVTKKMKKETKNVKSIDDLDDDMWDFAIDVLSISDLVKINVDPKEELSNGDTVKISFEYDNKEMKQYGLKLKGKPQTVSVKDLPEAQVLDVFKGFKPEFDGMAPKAYIDQTFTIEVEGKTVECTCDPYQRLDLGDKVTVTVSKMPEGYVAKQESMEITVENLEQLIINPSRFTTEDLAQLKDSVQKYIDRDEMFTEFLHPKMWGEKNNVLLDPERATVENRTIDDEAIFYGDSDNSDPNNTGGKMAIIYKIDANGYTPKRNDEQTYAGQNVQCYGAVFILELQKGADGKIDYQKGYLKTDLVTALYADKEELIAALKERYEEDYASLDQYSINLDTGKAEIQAQGEE